MKNLFVSVLLALLLASRAAGADCPPTAHDEIGPFYRPDAPVRAKVGEGYVLTGRVLSSEGCRPLPGSRIEFWLVGPEGRYGDAYQATVHSMADGGYRFECAPPPAYVGRPPHIHLMVTAAGHERLITQHYPQPGTTTAEMDLVLEPR